jgi:hypothetical protein
MPCQASTGIVDIHIGWILSQAAQCTYTLSAIRCRRIATPYLFGGQAMNVAPGKPLATQIKFGNSDLPGIGFPASHSPVLRGEGSCHSPTSCWPLCDDLDEIAASTAQATVNAAGFARVTSGPVLSAEDANQALAMSVAIRPAQQQQKSFEPKGQIVRRRRARGETRRYQCVGSSCQQSWPLLQSRPFRHRVPRNSNSASVAAAAFP